MLFCEGYAMKYQKLEKATKCGDVVISESGAIYLFLNEKPEQYRAKEDRSFYAYAWHDEVGCQDYWDGWSEEVFEGTATIVRKSPK